jgi:hypothetical protein
MLLEELIQRLDKSNANKQDIEVEDLQEILQYEFGIGMNLDATKAQTRVTCYWLANWYEDEGWLGFRVYFLDDRLLATSYTAIANNEDFTFANADIEKELKAYILTFEKEKELYEDNHYINPAMDLGDGYKLGYSYELIASHVMYKGQKCEVIDSRYQGNDITIKMTCMDETAIVTVDISEVDVCYNII